MTGYSAGTNYEVGCKHSNNSESVLWPRPGPYLLSPSMGIPTRALLTKSHCAGYDSLGGYSTCGMTTESFALACASPRSKTGARLPVYPLSKVVHIVRDPFDNMVARMHLAVDNGHVKRLEHSREGFLEWCRRVDGVDQAIGVRIFGAEVVELVSKVPCGVDLVHYVQWHNRALEMAARQGLESYVFHYEDYETDFEATVQSLMSFIGQPTVYPPAPFIAGKHYRDLYEVQEVESARQLLQRLASPACWELLRYYFD